METRDIGSREDLKKQVQDVCNILASTQSNGGAQVLALHGDLGAGKTTFVQEIALQMGITETVTSPTFVVMKQYSAGEDNTTVFETLIHIDAYRIEDIDEMRPLRLEEMLQQQNTLVCIEWAERIASLLPAHTLHAHLLLDGEKRTLSY